MVGANKMGQIKTNASRHPWSSRTWRGDALRVGQLPLEAPTECM